jgi:serine/threonine protein kinase/Tol biopolymer transport system component
MPLAENAVLGPYRIVQLIGEGGMGAVYRAQDTRLGRDVAIKVLTAVHLGDRERLVRFEQEARTTGMLNHPNLLTVYDVGDSDGTAYLVSELLQGETLRDRLLRGPLPPRKAVDAALQMALGLTAAHEKGVVHRDLKPENIFLTRDGRVKILDFGIAKLTARAANDGPMFQAAATEPGMVLGTVGYMAPEQVRGETVDHRADIFAFGAIVYEMLTGTRAFKRDSSIETLSAILKEEPPELTEVLPNIPAALDRLVRRCLEKDRELRFQTTRDLAFNLETLSTMSVPGTLSNVVNPVAYTRPGDPSPPTSALRASMPTLSLHSDPPANATSSNTAMRTGMTSARQRPTVSKPLPRRGISPVLLTILYLVSIAGAGFGGWYLANRTRGGAADPAFQRITFRRGEVRSARFSPDGDTIVYSAAWDGRPAEVFIGNRQTPEARPLGISDADVLAVSKSTELAVLLRRDRLTNLGTLARVPLAGGMPREVTDGVLQADWSPDGANLAIIHFVNGKFRIEYPIGSVRYETPHQIRDVRIAPDGRRIAFVEPHGGQFDVAVIDRGAPSPVARGWSHGVTGLAWSPDGQEIWITATDTSAPPALYAIPLNGQPRLVNRLTGSMKLFDIVGGRVLLTNGMWRAALEWQIPGETSERDMSWFDWSMLSDLSGDGRTLLFNETREGGGTKSAIYLRHSDAASPVRIGDGYGDALSPDGRWVLAHSGSKLVLLQTGAGESRELKIKGAFDNGAAWFPDSRRVVVAGAIPDHGYQLWVIDTLDETSKPVSPENIWGESIRPFAVSPDGRFVAGMSQQQTIMLYPAEGSGAPIAVQGVQRGEVPIQWTPDGLSLYVYRPTSLPPQVNRVELASGVRTLWKEFAPVDPAGVYKIAPIVMTRDASSYAYDALRMTNDLYVAENLR